jgi:hypothetical protein
MDFIGLSLGEKSSFQYIDPKATTVEEIFQHLRRQLKAEVVVPKKKDYSENEDEHDRVTNLGKEAKLSQREIYEQEMN